MESISALVKASNALRKKLNIILPQLKLESNDWACSSNCIPQSTPIEADVSIPNEAGRSVPTEVELCLLFCSMFPEGFRLPIEDLVMYGMALNLFEDVHNMSQARCRVDSLIEFINHRMPPYYLNKLCLWEEEYGDRYVKILYSALDLAKLIASKYQLAFCPESMKRTWPSTDWEKYCYGLSLVLRRINQHPVYLECPKLAFLQLQHIQDSQSIPADLFEGIKELLVLSLDVPSLPHSLDVLSNLRMLRLKVLRFEDMSCIGGLIDLEFLSISTPSLTDIPKEMGQLGNLRLLDLRKMNIAWFPPGVLSRMLKLEELYLPLSFRRWGCRAQDEHDDYDEWGSWEEDDYDDKERINASIKEINDGERMNASISEIVSCSLNALQIVVPKASIFPKKAPIFKNMQRFKILVPNNLKYRPLGKWYSLNVLQLTGDAYDIKESGICDLMSRTEELNLTRVRNLKNVMFELEDYDFPQLQKMIISECDELEYVVDAMEKQILSENNYLFSKLESLHLSILSNLKEIWHGRWTKLRWFENLSRISIRFCHKLNYVLPLSIVKGCALLKSVEILNCNEMEGIFFQDEEDVNPLVHYFIEELDLHSLPKLVGFLVHNDTSIDWVNDGTNPLTTNEIVSNSMEGSRLDGISVDDEEIIYPPPTSISRGKLPQLFSNIRGKLRQLVTNKQVSPIKNNDIVSHTETYAAFSSKLTEKWLQNLKRLKIAFCDAVEVIFQFEENHVTTRAFNSLKELELYGLRNLMHIWFSVPPEIIAFQNLQLLVLSECQNLYLFPPRVAKLLVQLQKVSINRCEKMEIILKEDENETENKISFPQLKLLELQHMPNLRTFSSGIYPIELPLVESLKFDQCNKMGAFSYGPLWTPMLGRIQINGSLYSIWGDLNATIERYMMGNCFGTPSNDAHPSSIISTNSSDFSAASQLREANPNSQILKAPNSLNCSVISSNGPSTVGSSNYTYREPSTIASEADGEENPNGQVKSPNSPLAGSSNDTYSESSTIISIPTSQCSVVTSEENEEANVYGQILEGPNYMKEFTFADLEIATKNFSSDNLLGKGGFGDVYKGWLKEKTFAPSRTGIGRAVAIKKCMQRSRHGFQQWQTEVKALERQSHPNLVKFIGYCSEDRELILVYEFIQRGCLFDHLHRRNPGIEPLSWDMRIKISIGAARGLNFLHTLKKKVIHRDIKSTNILLDSDYNAKITDFGLAIWEPSDGNSHVTTMRDYVNISDLDPLERSWPSDGYSNFSTRVMGTMGYIDPDYARTGRLSVESDVYSFGVVLLELMTGLRVLDHKRPEEQRSLVAWLKSILAKKSELENLMDSTMEGQYSSKAMLMTAKLASKCTKDEPRKRPSIGEVLKELQQIDAFKEKEND
ncbi:uncharacterized protein [Euphorbia lathyris]|uniref:uncharacterized protein isoform X2 n=1 Tax=Euphorbia lathyris TaxID=212925 RepID=UPI0033142371